MLRKYGQRAIISRAVEPEFKGEAAAVSIVIKASLKTGMIGAGEMKGKRAVVRGRVADDLECITG